MPAARYDITIEQGASWGLKLTYRDSEGEPVDLTSHSAKMQIRQDYADTGSRVCLELTQGNGLTLSDGSIEIAVTPEQSSGLKLNKGRYDLVLSRDGDVQRLLQGVVKVSPTVTA